MKIVVVGALAYANFGDVLFANLFYQELLKKHSKDEILIYESPLGKLTQTCREELNYYKKCTLRDIKTADALVYISGGYFANNQNNMLQNLRWYVKYMRPGVIMGKRNKDIYVIGIGGGKIQSSRCQAIARFVLNHAKFISTRNEETKDDFLGIGVTVPVEVTSDTAQIVSKTDLIQPKEVTDFLPDFPVSKKAILLHVTPVLVYARQVQEKVLPALNRFLAEHDEYGVIATFDGYVSCKYESFLDNTLSQIDCTYKCKYHYNYSVDFCNLLNCCSMVITPKLHVGIVGSSLEKSVLSFPLNPDKTHRYYKNIGYAERSRTLSEVTSDEVYQMMARYFDKMVILPKSIYKEAWKNIEHIKEI